jgi:hypothetical protein
MKSSSMTARAAAGGLVVAALTVLQPGVDAAPVGKAAGDGERLPAARTTHEIYTSEVGVRRPTGLSWNPDRQTLMVTGARAAGGSKVVAVTPGEKVRGTTPRPALEEGSVAAYDPAVDRVTARTAGAVDPAGAAYSPDGTLHVLDAATNTVLEVARDGAVDRVPLKGLRDASLRGLAYQPRQKLLYVADTSGRKDTLYAVNGSGAVVRRQDLTAARIADLRAMTFAPSADTTDPATDQSLYVADAGTSTTLGRVAEVNLAPVTAAATTTVATRANTVSTGAWSTPSPDPSGITYLSDSDRLLVSDGEVDELPLYEGANLYHATRSGALGATGTTLPPGQTAWSAEPTGVAYGSRKQNLFVSDDDKRTVFEVSSVGADGNWGTSDDGARTSLNTAAYGSADSEDVAYDSKRNQLLVIDGVNAEIYRIGLAPEGGISGTATGTNSDLERFGVLDPEGIAYDAVRDTVVVVNDARIWELDTSGALLGSADISSYNLKHAAGITIAPASDGSGERNYYVVDRGVDNDSGSNADPNETDGVVYEFGWSQGDVGNRPPFADAGEDKVLSVGETVRLTGKGSDDGVPSPLTYSWSKVSGPGNVTFGSAASAATDVSVSAAGNYVLRLTVSDSALSDTDDVALTAHQSAAARTVSVPITQSSDDAQEGGGTRGTSVRLTSADNELGRELAALDSPAMVTGFRFPNLPVPAGSQILSAKIQFRTDEVGTDVASFTIKGEASDNAATYVAASGNISARPTVGSVAWAPPAWNTVGEAGAAQLTSELGGILQQVVNRPGWRRDNAAAFVVSGTGRRTAQAFDGGLGTPVLVLEFKTPAASGQPPVVTPPAPAPQPAAPVISLRSSTGDLVAGRRVTLSGSMTRSGAALASQGVEVFAARAPRYQQQRIGVTTTGSSGSFTLTDLPSTTTRYVVRPAGSSASSRTVQVVVHHRLTAALSRTTVHRARPVAVRGRVLPGAAGQRVYLQRKVGTTWRSVKRVVTTQAYTFRLRPARAGAYRYRVVASAWAGRASAVSPTLRLRVLRGR